MTFESHLAVLAIANMIVTALFVVTPVSDRIFFGGAVVAASLALLSLVDLVT